jgi:hypothetical protein
LIPDDAMTRIQALRILNLILAPLMVFQIISGLNPATIPYVVHQDMGIAIGGLVFLHLILNWNWIRINILRWK